mgnify:CR=1 FL=1
MAGGESIVDKIKNALDNLVKLNIVTAVGDIVYKDADKKDELDLTKTKASMTVINLLDGDITTIFHESFITGEYKDLKNFHAEREKEGYERVKANIAALGDLLKLAASPLLGKN